MDNVTYRDNFVAVNQDGYWVVAKVEHDDAGTPTGISGPVFPQGADLDGLRVQLIRMQTALESPLSADEFQGRFGSGAKMNLRDVVPSRSDEDIQEDGAFSGSSEVAGTRNGLEEQLTTRAAQAAQHIAEAKLAKGEASPTPEVAVSLVPKQADPEALQEAAREMAK